MKDWKLNTKSIHIGEPRPRINHAVTLPIFQSATFEYTGADNYNQVQYIRLNNTPNHVCLNQKIAALENAESAVVTGSGMAAVTTALLGVVEKGGHVLSQDSLYGGTHFFFRENFIEMGREFSFFSLDKLDELPSLLRKNTKAIYVESISNPMLRVPDFKRIIEFAKKHQLISIIDNTLPSPVLFNPCDIGFDLVVHSATKYLNGHSDIVAGCIVGKKNLVEASHKLLNILGAALNPHACFLLERGIKTIGLRVPYQNDSSLKVAESLLELKKIKKVIYPGLKSHPDYGLIKDYMKGFGAIVSFDYGGSVEDLSHRLSQLEFFAEAPSLGGVESLITRPATTSHASIPKDLRLNLGITDTLVRISVGIEDPIDLISDLRNCFG